MPREGFIRLSPINRRRWQNFRANRRGYWSFWIFLVLFVLSLFAEFIANDRPIVASYKGEWLFPVFVDYPEEKFGGFLAQHRLPRPGDPKEIEENGWAIWPPIRFSYNTHNLDLPVPARRAADLDAHGRAVPPDRRAHGGTGCRDIEWNWLGTDDQGRDVVARLIYGFRISVLFGLILAGISSVIGVVAGAVQGYFGGWTDLLFQRFIEIWTSIPALYLLIIISSIITPSFWVLLGILLLFSWVSLVGVVRAEFLRGPQLRIRARRAGARPVQRHHHVQAPPAERHGGDAHLPALHPQRLDHDAHLARLPRLRPAARLALARRAPGAGQGQPPGAVARPDRASSSSRCMLSLLIFIGEAVRDAFDPRKTFR